MAQTHHQSHRLPGLDGLRALSIALVMVYHLSMAGRVFEAGSFGVEIFFTISGLLITWLLLREEAAHGSISLRQFYARRAVRILPPAMAYLLVVLTIALHAGHMIWHPWISSVLFYRNFNMTPDAAMSKWWVDTAHYWSLSTEEQFYLIWPLLFIVLGRRLRIAALGLILVAEPIWRHLMIHFSHGGPVPVFRIDLHCDGIVMGCLLACLMESPRTKKWLAAPVFRSDWTALIAAGIVCLTFTPRAMRSHGQVIYPTLQAVCVALIVYRLIRKTGPGESLLDRTFNFAPIAFVGQLSYSLYLWQQPFCMPNGVCHLSHGWMNVLAACGCALGSYFIIEKPSQTVRKWLGSRTAPATN